MPGWTRRLAIEYKFAVDRAGANENLRKMLVLLANVFLDEPQVAMPSLAALIVDASERTV
jgi:hypothetical protein